MKTNSKQLLGVISAFPLILLLGSCGNNNFKNIEEFGLTSAVIKESSANMANDIYQSCLRQKRYLTDKRFSDSVGIPEREEREKDCDKNQSDAQTVTDVNEVLIDYMVALGKLASNDAVSFEKNLDALENSLKNFNNTLGATAGLKEDQVNAGLKIARFIFNSLTTQFRQENLNQAILCTNQPVQDYIPGLVSIVQEFYVNGILRSEGVNLDSYYRKYAPTPEEQSQLLALFTIEQNYIKDVDALKERKQAAYAYIEILEKTATTHQKLTDELNQPAKTEKEIEDSCQKYFSADGDSQSAQTSLPSPKQLKRINEIVMEYRDEIRPLVKQLDKTF